MAVTYLEISYPNFVLGAIIDPAEANQNNYEIVTKINSLVGSNNTSETNIINLGISKADIVYVDDKILNLSGIGRTTQTVKANFDAMVAHKTSGDHDGRYYTKTLLDGGQLDNRYYTETEINSKIATINTKDTAQDTALSNHKGSTDHNNLYYTKTELTPWLRGGDTNIKEEVFTIVNSNNGDGTFSYTINSVDIITGNLDEQGYQIFTLNQGVYEPGTNRIECWVGDTLRRSVSSGGLKEIDVNLIGLSPEGDGAEITFKYYERIGMTAEYTIKMSTTKPPQNNGKNMWFKLLN